MPSFIDLTSFDLKLSGDGAATISCGKRFHVLMVRARNECRYWSLCALIFWKLWLWWFLEALCGLITYCGSSSLWCLCTDLWKDASLFTSRRSCRVHHPSEDLICETLVCLPQSCITYLAPLFWTLSSSCIRVVWWGSHTLDPYSNWGRTNPVKIWFLICVVVPFSEVSSHHVKSADALILSFFNLLFPW